MADLELPGGERGPLAVRQRRDGAVEGERDAADGAPLQGEGVEANGPGGSLAEGLSRCPGWANVQGLTFRRQRKARVTMLSKFGNKIPLPSPEIYSDGSLITPGRFDLTRNAVCVNALRCMCFSMVICICVHQYIFPNTSYNTCTSCICTPMYSCTTYSYVCVAFWGIFLAVS